MILLAWRGLAAVDPTRLSCLLGVAVEDGPRVGSGTAAAHPVGRALRQVAKALLAALALFAGGGEKTFADDRAALVALYDSTGGLRWTDDTNWLSSEPLSEWFGVALDADGRVQRLDLSANGLEGQIPAALGRLSRLRALDLSENSLNGPIPAELGDLESLNTLLLSENALSGLIPAELGNLSRLVNLGLGENALSGQVPPQLANLVRLRFVDLGKNSLTGQIPEELGNLAGLRYLTLWDNSLTGPVPPSLGRLTELKLLGIERNDLEGALPVELANLTGLEDLRTHGNEVCAPRDAAFQFWLDNVSFYGVTCPPEDLTVVDLAIAYTRAARTSLGGEARIKAEIDLLIAEANYAYAQSGINLRLDLAAASEVQYQGTNSRVDLDRLQDPVDGHLDEVHELRDAAGADIAFLVVGSEAWGFSTTTCGRSSQLTASWLSNSFARLAFAVMRVDCGASTFVHELGHLMGVAHDRYESCSGERCFSGAFPYGHGYVNQRAFERALPFSARWRTVMAYEDQCVDSGFRCQQLMRFSNPAQSMSGVPMGVPGRHESSDVNGPSDAVRTLNLTRELVSNFRARAIDGSPVSVFFDTDAYTAAEGGPAASVTVRLSAPANGAIAIPLTVSLEHGASFEDYSEVPRQVLFANGETAATFKVVASDDLVDDNDERVVLGFGPLPRGATESDPSSAAVALRDNDLTAQAIELPSGAEVLLTRDGDGPWLLDGEQAVNGAAVVSGGRTHVLELADGQWRLARYAVRTAAGQTGVEDGIEGTRASLFEPVDVATDALGNVYISDSRHHRIRIVDPSGVISTLAGTGDWGFAGEGGPAAAAQLHLPAGVALASNGDLYVADTGNHRVLRIDVESRAVQIVAGPSHVGFSVEGGPAKSPALMRPWGVAADAAGSVYVTDQANNTVRRIDTATGSIDTVAGTGSWGFSGDGGPAVQAMFQRPSGIALDTLGRLYVADTWSHRVRRIDLSTGWIETLAGSAGSGYAGDGGMASEAVLNRPIGVAVDASGSVYVADTGNQRVRKIDVATGIVSTVGGIGTPGYSGDGETGAAARLARPRGLAVDATGNLYVADSANHRVRRIDSATGIITTFAGSGSPALRWTGGNADEARMESPTSLALDPAGNVVFIDSNRVWKLDAGGMVEKLAGPTWSASPGDGGASSEASFAYPHAIAVDTGGNVYVADTWNHRVLRIAAATGMIESFAGRGEKGDSGDGGAASEATLDRPKALAVDVAGNVFVADSGNRRIRRIDNSTGMIETVAGAVSGGRWGDGGLATETLFRDLTAVAVDASGNLYLADGLDDRVLRIDVLTGLTETVLEVDYPRALALDGDGNLFVGARQRILMVGPEGEITLVAGTGRPGFSGDGEPAAGAELSVSGIAVDRMGSVWFTDPMSRRIRVLDPWGARN